MKGVVLIALLAACYRPTFVDCEVTCGMTRVCPDGLSCNASGYCVADMTASCSAMPDGPTSDAPPLPTGPWGAAQPVQIGGTVGVSEGDPTLTDDMLEMHLTRYPDNDTYLTRRGSLTTPWGLLMKVQELSASAVNENDLDISGDGLTMFLSYYTGAQVPDIFMATRPTRTSAWSAPAIVSPISTAASETGAAISRDGLMLVFASTRNGTKDIWIAQRPTTTSAWNTPVVSPMISNPSIVEDTPFLASDKLTIYYASAANGNLDLFKATRPPGGVFADPTPMSELNTTADESDPWVSADGKTIYFTRTSGSTITLMRATR